MVEEGEGIIRLGAVWMMWGGMRGECVEVVRGRER